MKTRGKTAPRPAPRAGAHTPPIGLGPWRQWSRPLPPGISTDSARGPETTGTNRADSDNQHPLDLGRALEGREDPGGRGSFSRSAACRAPGYQHGFSTPYPRSMPVSVRAASGFERSACARREGTHSSLGPPSAAYSAAGTPEVHSYADLRLFRLPQHPVARARRGQAARGRTPKGYRGAPG